MANLLFLGSRAVYSHKSPKTMKVKGRDLYEGLPKEIEISSTEMLEALVEPITAILDGVCSVIEKTPPELVGDIIQHGIVMTGGGSLLSGLDSLIECLTGIPTKVAPNALTCVTVGMGKLLDMIDEGKDEAISLARDQRNRK